MAIDATIIDTAIGWHIRQNELTGDGWEAFVAWLEESPAHAAAFDSVAMADRFMPEIPEVAPDTRIAANDDTPMRGRWLWTAGGGAIAAALAVLVVPMAMPGKSQPYELQTAPGARQVAQLGDGSSVELSGGTRLKLDHNNNRVATLMSGEATFHVVHDAADPFTLRSGDITIRDVGTVFNVSRNGTRLDIQVAEGSVLFQPDRDAVILKAGQALTVREDMKRVTFSSVMPETVGGWRHGSLSFSDERLESVFAAIQRTYGFKVTLAGDLPQRPFTGMVAMTGAVERDIPHLAMLIGAEWRRDGDQWILSPRESATR